MNETPSHEPTLYLDAGDSRRNAEGQADAVGSRASGGRGWRKYLRYLATAKEIRPSEVVTRGAGNQDRLRADPDKATEQRSFGGAGSVDHPAANSGSPVESVPRLAEEAEMTPSDEHGTVEMSTEETPHQPAAWESAIAKARGLIADGDRETAAAALRASADQHAMPPHASMQVAELLRELGHDEDADAVLKNASEKFPEDRPMAAAYAWAAFHRRDWQAANERLTPYVERFPEDAAGYEALGRALGEMGPQYSRRADMAFESGLLRYPSEPGLIGGYARLAHSRGAWGEALARWSTCVRRRPSDPAGYVGAGWSLCELGRFDEADELLGRALQQFPDNPEVVSVYARVASKREDWQEALRRWTIYRDLRPGDPFGAEQVRSCQEGIESAGAGSSQTY